jgi:transposase
LVRSRTLLVNQVRGLLKCSGVKIPACSVPAVPRRVAPLVPPILQPAVYPLLEMIVKVNAAIGELDRRVHTIIKERYPHAQLVRQPRGVGPITSLAFVLAIGDPRRFPRSRQVGAYFGLQPKRNQSGGRDPELSISKAGDGDVRRLLVQASHYMLGPFGEDSDLRRHGLRLAGRGGKNAKKRAVVAVARKLAVLLHRLWVTAEVYEPLRTANRGTRQAA